MDSVKLEVVEVRKPSDVNVILGQTHFIKTVEDLYEALMNSVPGIKFGIAFCEASGDCLVRTEGTDKELTDLAAENALKIGAGHVFVVMLRGVYPVNVLNAVKAVPEVCCIYAATANPLKVVVAVSGGSRGVLGVLDGLIPKGVEDLSKKAERHSFLRKIGYKK